MSWFSLIDEDLVDLGCCILSKKADEQEAKALVEEAIRSYPELDPVRLEHGGGIIPFALPLPTLVENHFAVLGEAAGSTDPSSGFGIENAIQSAICLASHLEDRSTIEALWPYDRAIQHSIGTKNILHYVPFYRLSLEQLEWMRKHDLLSDSVVGHMLDQDPLQKQGWRTVIDPRLKERKEDLQHLYALFEAYPNFEDFQTWYREYEKRIASLYLIESI